MDEQRQIWEVVNEQIDLSKSKRLNWKGLLGKSLTKYVAKGKALGLSAREIYNHIITKHPYLLDDARRRLWISICARFAEMNSEFKEYFKTKEKYRKK